MNNFTPVPAGATRASRSFFACLLAFALLTVQLTPVVAAPLGSARNVRGGAN